ncbi:hypothetical protein GIY30_20770 [Gordonia sp. HNM0687]|uniref:Uncharacterized protein n=1 Tax=Gordonia mangrovi TaxID=2665643 RepID=A0A6L7GYI4_9ACTN|nr:hypothetical protein [Gordonia mangrovi]MXP23775.1 hypothetical protein [Gordonia mangrovi]UVF79829.1 hypothetical protein NWF22_08390 [Gordonia mangrovi]
MTDPDDPDRIPTQAELDAEDLAEIAHTSRDRDHANLYPPRPGDPGPPPAALSLHARVAWWGAAIAGLVSAVYGFINLGLITDLLRARLLQGVLTDPRNASPEDQVDTLAGFFPPFMLVMIVVFLVVEYALLVAAASRHSRNSRNFFLAAVAVNLLCIPIGIDLLFDYPEVWSAMSVIAWLQFGLLILAALFTLRRNVNQWLPDSTRMRPTRVFRER